MALKYTEKKNRNDSDISMMCSDVLKVLKNCIEIQEGATNGEVIESLFPNVSANFSNIIDLNLWWKAKYKAESEEKKMETVKIVIELSEEDYKLALSRAALLGGMLDKKLVDAVRSGRRIEEQHECSTCKFGSNYKNGYDVTTMDDECGGCCSWNDKWQLNEESEE